MLKLVVKDLYLLRKSNIYIILYSLFMSIIGMFQNDVAYFLFPMCIFMMVYVTSFYINSYDDKNDSEVYFVSLPINKKDIVRAKYLSLILYIILFGISTIIFTNAIKALDSYLVLNILNGKPANIWNIIGALISILFFYSFYYPFYFKFGGNKLRMANSLIFMIIVLLPAALSKLSGGITDNVVFKWVTSLKYEQGLLLFSGVFLALYIVSMLLSQCLYYRRDI
ncbi:ABC-2 transporter permease [Abyssisolibacter fermentans]|uniref:ABC-2 transporter permease n=1 Tax=Abyssisolibacter fermentans TaxID=1766203 RepID=UPI000836AB7C|nr:ABC-2 transporter permease [Abyssisolibacter fermentans]